MTNSTRTSWTDSFSSIWLRRLRTETSGSAELAEQGSTRRGGEQNGEAGNLWIKGRKGPEILGTSQKRYLLPETCNKKSVSLGRRCWEHRVTHDPAKKFQGQERLCSQHFRVKREERGSSGLLRTSPLFLTFWQKNDKIVNQKSVYSSSENMSKFGA